MRTHKITLAYVRAGGRLPCGIAQPWAAALAQEASNERRARVWGQKLALEMSEEKSGRHSGFDSRRDKSSLS